ncbi:MAG: hypothetical protein JWQ98_176 [Chlorobi bacterium]|nr:hypothetical protein [Chlorobiota bacterium]
MKNRSSRSIHRRSGLFGMTAVAMVAGLTIIFSACKHDPVAPDPHTISDGDLAAMAANALGGAQGGLRNQFLDLVRIARGEELTKERKADGHIQPVVHAASQTINGGTYTYSYSFDYDYLYGCFSSTETWNPKTDCILYGFRMRGTRDNPTSHVEDSGYTQSSSGDYGPWDIHLSGTGRYLTGVCNFSRSGSETLKASGKTYQRTLHIQFRFVQIDSATGVLVSPEPNSDRTNVSVFDLYSVKAPDGFVIEKADGSAYHGEIFFRADNTALIKYGTSSYVMDMITGEIKN